MLLGALPAQTTIPLAGGDTPSLQVKPLADCVAPQLSWFSAVQVQHYVI